MKNKLAMIALAALVFTACHDKKQPAAMDMSAMKKDSSVATPVYTAEMVVNTVDPSCKMPLNGKVGDTAHYDGKVYGFCSKMCKEEFEKNPAAHLEAK